MMWIKNPVGGGLNLLTITDDGLNLVWTYNGVVQFKIRKSDRQLLLDAGVDDDAF